MLSPSRPQSMLPALLSLPSLTSFHDPTTWRKQAFLGSQHNTLCPVRLSLLSALPGTPMLASFTWTPRYVSGLSPLEALLSILSLWQLVAPETPKHSSVMHLTILG